MMMPRPKDVSVMMIDLQEGYHSWHPLRRQDLHVRCMPRTRSSVSMIARNMKIAGRVDEAEALRVLLYNCLLVESCLVVESRFEAESLSCFVEIQ